MKERSQGYNNWWVYEICQNTSADNYTRTVQNFKTRLQARNYPPQFVNKTAKLVTYSNRLTYLRKSNPEKSRIRPPPLFKCIPPPQFHHLKQIILKQFALIQKYVPNPRFIPLRQKTLSQILVRAQVQLNDDQLTTGPSHLIRNTK